MSLIREMKAQELVPKTDGQFCTNCKTEECLNGKLVTRTTGLSIGSKVTISTESQTYWPRYGADEYNEKVYTVIQELQENIVKTIDVFDKEGIFYIIRERIPTFCFICK